MLQWKKDPLPGLRVALERPDLVPRHPAPARALVWLHYLQTGSAMGFREIRQLPGLSKGEQREYVRDR